MPTIGPLSIEAGLTTGPGAETVAPPFAAFNFEVAIRREDEPAPLCNAAFAECDGLEQTMEVKTVREGGNNSVQVRLAGPVTYGQLTLRRGMTGNFDLWDWFAEVQRSPWLRAAVEVTLLAPDRKERARFALGRCLPLKVKAPALNAREGTIAIEELQLAYESLTLRPPGGSGG